MKANRETEKNGGDGLDQIEMALTSWVQEDVSDIVDLLLYFDNS